jgi:hypothetical protein
MHAACVGQCKIANEVTVVVSNHVYFSDRTCGAQVQGVA